MTASAGARFSPAGALYLAVAGGVGLALVLAGRADLWPGWLGFAGLGGIGTAIKGQLADVAKTVGTQHAENGDSLTSIATKQLELEEYTHNRMHELASGITAIKAALALHGLMPTPAAEPTPRPPRAPGHT